MPNSGVTIRLAEGGYIVEWMERHIPKSEEAGGEARSYLEQERHAGLTDCLHEHRFAPPHFKCAVRVKLEDALKLAGEVLARLQEVGVEEDLGGSFISGA